MTRVCVVCGSANLEFIRYRGFARKECVDCGSTGPFGPAGENPAYGPGNEDWERDREREDRA